MFQEIGRRLADGLTSLLIMRDLRKREERLHSIFVAVEEGIVFQERGGKIVAANPSAEKMLGYREKELLGRAFLACAEKSRVVREDGSPFPGETHPFVHTLRTGQPQRNVVMGLHQPDGTLVWISVNSQPLIAKGESEPYAVVTSFHDITERKRIEAALQRSNRELQAIGDCNQALLRAVDEPTLLNDICHIICDKANYRMAWVGYAEHDEARTVRPVAWAGSENGYLAGANITWADVDLGRGPTGTAIRSGESVCIQDFVAYPQAARWRESALRRGYRSSIALPLKDERAETFGALNIYSTEPNAFMPDEMRLLEGLAGDLAYGIGALRARAERKRAEQEREEHTAFLASMNRINLAIQGNRDLDSMMSAVLDEVLAIFECDRAFLLYPCNPNTDSWTVPMERTKPEYPGVRELGIDVPIDPEMEVTFQLLLATDGVLKFGLETDHPLPMEVAERFGFKSMMATALYPKLGDAWEFGIHQCSYERVWTAEEQRLLLEISRRLVDSLTNLLVVRELQESEAKYRRFVETSNEGIWGLDQDHLTTFVNVQTAEMLGYAIDELIGHPLSDFMFEEDIADYERHMEARRQGVSEHYERRLRRKDGGELWTLVSATAITDGGHFMGSFAMFTDITKNKQTEQELKVREREYRTLVDNLPDCITRFDANYRTSFVNVAVARTFGMPREAILGKTLSESGRPGDELQNRELEQLIHRVFEEGVANKIEALWMTADGERIFDILHVPERDDRGRVVSVLGIAHDVTERKQAEEQIESLAFYDPLTHLPNRRLLLDRLQQALASGARDGRVRALLFIDLDNFKLLNDTFGHDTGDRLLTDVAYRLSACVRKGDTVARLGGDEFVALLENLSDKPQEAAARAKNTADKILSRLGEPYSIAGHEHHSTASLGITVFADAKSVDELLKKADIAMYQAKLAGRNTVSFFDPATQAALASRAQLQATLRIAVREHEFVLYYQPQIDIARGIIGAEALVRWKHPERGLVLPSQFIPLAEESGLILDIGRWQLSVASDVLRAWALAPATRDLRLAINVSARQFRQTDFVEQVRTELSHTGAPASRLKIELTEHVVLDDVEGTIAKMRALKALGIGISLDDFGIGYSSLSYLTRLPLDELKIDQSFVRNLPDNPTDAAVVQTIIALAKTLGLGVLAEGVESVAQRQFLQTHRCPTYQGYLFSEPVTLTRFEQLL